ncbi:MAG: hypothetical protein DWI22_11575 [Planctomycetota bacterium]|nr:MAG: hypothetical protein DWI22_11575 [Planctomycetota bacterium]
MLDAQSLLPSQRRVPRILGFHQVSAPRPKIFLACGEKHLPMLVVQAINFDVLVSGICDLDASEAVNVEFTSMISTLALTIPGRIHWRDDGHSQTEYGIVLNESLPEEFVVRAMCCSRNGLRFSTQIPGTLSWLERKAMSTSANVVNYSREGICLQCNVAPDIGTKMQFAWNKNGEDMSVAGIVCWTIRRDCDCLTGCELTNENGYAISDLLLGLCRKSI